MSRLSSDRNLLFGILALQMELVTRDQLIAAMHEWLRDEGPLLGEILVRQQVLSDRQRSFLDGLVRQRLGADEDSPETEFGPGAQEPAGGKLASEALQGLWNEPHPTIPGTCPSLDSDAKSVPGAVVGGRLQVLQLHAEGGLGRVMLARDCELGRDVAVKEIKPKHASDSSSRQRFVLESEITARLEHPGIVPVYDRGAYPDGRPYYVMRFIQGANLDEAIKRFHQEYSFQDSPGAWTVELHKLLRRFLDICQTLQFAHSRGVVHRDVKPSNVMLGKYGETLIVDWGLAKVVGRVDAVKSLGETTLQLSPGSGSDGTLPDSALGTPAYMSPEQAGGRHAQVGPSSDVYGLGATLYCLLTGKAPFRDSDLNRLLEKKKQGEFPPPRAIKPEIPAPLEAICLKAMALQAEDRYETPAGLIADLEHWLADEPTSAYAETRGERVARWMRRHRTRVQAAIVSLAVTATVLLLATVLVTRSWQSEKAARELAMRSKQEAVARFAQAREAVDKWLTGAGYALGHYPSVQKARERLLELAAHDYEEFSRQRSDDLELEIERGRTYLRLGHVRLVLRDAAGATAAYQQARTLFSELARRSPKSVDCQVELANCQTNAGVVAMETGDIGQADQAYQTSVSQLEAIVLTHPEAALPRTALARALLDQGELLSETGRPEEALRSLTRCVEVLRRLVQERPQAREHQASLVDAQDLLGYVLLTCGRYADAVKHLQDAADRAATLKDLEPGDPQRLEHRASAEIYLASALRVLGRVNEEENAYRRAIEDYALLCDVLPGVPQFRESRAISQNDLTGLHYKLGRLEDAERELKPAQEAIQQLMTENPGFPRYVDEWARGRDLAGEILRDRGQATEAQAACRDAIDAYERLLPDADQGTSPEVAKYLESLALCQSHLGQTLHLLGDIEAADRAFQKAIEMATRIAAKSPLVRDSLGFIHQHRGTLWESQGRQEEAAREFGLAKQIWTELASASDAAAEHRYHLAWLLVNCQHAELRDPQKAAILARELTVEAPGNPAYWNCLGVASYRLGLWESSAQTLEKACVLRGCDDARDGFFLAMAHWQLKREDQARKEYGRARRTFEQTMPGNLEVRRLAEEASGTIERRQDRVDATSCTMPEVEALAGSPRAALEEMAGKWLAGK